MKQKIIELHQFFKNSMPYMLVLVLVFFLVNFVKLREIQNDIYAIQQDVENTQSDVADLYEKNRNNHVDNSDVIQAIRAHHKVISNQIDEAERQIKANAIIGGR